MILLLLNACAGVETYQVGDYSVHITGHSKVNEEYQKVCLFNCSRGVNGFVNYHKREMWSIPDRTVIMHEMKHIVEGHFHEKQASLD